MAQAITQLQANGGHAAGIPCDVGELAQVRALRDHALDTFGQFDIWINNAGIAGPYGPTAHIAPEMFTTVLQTNIIGTYHGSWTAMQHFLLGTSPEPLSRSPFMPVNLKHRDLLPEELNICPYAHVHVLPLIAGFVGADCVAATLATGLDKTSRTCFLMDIGTNTEIVVGSKDRVFGDELTATGLNWIAIASPTSPITVKARIRYRHREAEATVNPLDESRVSVKFKEPQMAITPGQAVVFYDGDIVIGGGTIESAGKPITPDS